MTKRKLTKHEDDVRRGLRKVAEINPAQSPHDIIEEQDAQIEALKQDLLEKAAAVRSQFANSEQENARLNNYIERLEVRNAELVPENAHLKAEVERLTALVESNLNSSKVAIGKADAVLHERDSLKAEVERLDTLCKQLGKQHSDISCENVMLRKAGDELAKRTEFFQKRWDADELCQEVEAWNAAKEGKQS